MTEPLVSVRLSDSVLAFVCVLVVVIVAGALIGVTIAHVGTEVGREAAAACERALDAAGDNPSPTLAALCGTDKP